MLAIDTSTAATWARTWLDRIEHVTENGLPAAYQGDVFDFLCDECSGNLPWQEEKGKEVQQLIESDLRFPELQKRFRSRFGRKFWA